jgi:hypothetical protein
MKYEIKSDDQEDGDSFEIFEVKVIKEKTRARIVTWIVAVWLLLLLITAVDAAITGHHGDLQTILGLLTPLVVLGFSWYLGKERSE